MRSPARRITTPPMLIAAVLLTFLLVLGATTVAGKLLGLIEHHDGSTAFDRSITTSVVTHRTSALTTFARALSVIGSQRVLLPAVAVVAVVLLVRGARSLAAALVIIWAGAIGLYTLAKDFVGRPRPPMHLWLTSASGSAFPSGHAVQSLSTFVAMALVGAALVPAARRAALALALVSTAGVGWSRVYLGVHWTTDVLAGWAAGACWVASVAWLARTRSPTRRLGQPPVRNRRSRSSNAAGTSNGAR